MEGGKDSEVIEEGKEGEREQRHGEKDGTKVGREGGKKRGI